MLIRFGYEIALRCWQPTPLVCLLSPADSERSALQAPEVFSTTPAIPTHVYRDLFGNSCRRMTAPAGELVLWGDATIEDDGLPDLVNVEAGEVPVQDLPDECLIYLMGSRYCETDLLSQAAWDMFGDVAPGWNRVQAICDFVNRHITFDYQQADSTRGALGVFKEKVGVCRDFAHLAIALCRCMNIPARYVNSHLSDIGGAPADPMDFAASIEVYLEGGWYTFDPRNNRPRTGRIVLARGRDAADIPLINSFGPHALTSFRVWTYEVPEHAALEKELS